MEEQQQRLVEKIRSRDAAAETELFAKYKDAILWKVCRHIETDPGDIKDVVSEVCLAILKGLRDSAFDTAKWPSLDAYVWGVTNNKVRDWYTQDRKERRTFSFGSLAEEVASYTEEYLLEEKELNAILKEMLQKLKSPYREALELRYFQECSIQEMSERLGIPPRRVSERIHYSIKLLRNAWKKGKILSISGLTLLLPVMKGWGAGL